MRIVVLLLCLVLGACAGDKLDLGAMTGPGTAYAPPPADDAKPAPVAVAPAAPPPTPSPPPPAARAARAAPVPAPTPPAALSEPERLMQARGECWMLVERERSISRDIDKRAAFVDKCVAGKMKAKP